MSRRPNNAPIKPEKRRPKDEDYTVINLAMLTRFSIFIDEVRSSDGPVSFRSFMKGRGSHRTMALTVDALETLAQQLLLRRQILDDEGKPTNRYIMDYSALAQVRTRRENGVSRHDGITPHGHVWAEFGELLTELFEIMVDGGDDPESLRKFLGETRQDMQHVLKQVRSRKRFSK